VPAQVQVRIYDLLGQEVRRLDLEWRERGRYLDAGAAAYWDGCGVDGVPVSTGVYVYILEAGDFRATRRITLLR